MNKSFPLLSFSIFLLLISGCATGGRVAYTYLKLEPINFDKNKAYVYFYRPCKIWGVARGFTVSESERIIGGLNCSSYFVLEADPGIYHFHADDWLRGDKILKLELERGKEYFVKADLRIGIIDAVPSLTLMDSSVKDKIKNLKRVPLYQKIGNGQ